MSASSKRIAILLHRDITFQYVRYLLSEIAEVWRENGFSVSVVEGPESRVEADLAILHVDLTKVPADYLGLAARYPVVLNGRVADISKRRVSANLVRQGDGWRGPVIVKTDRNCGGLMEARVARRGPPWRRVASKLRDFLPWTWRSRLSTDDYRVFPSLDDVPFAVWRNPHLVVERFLPERRDGFYCLRTWVFLGDKETNSLSYSHEPVIKLGNVVRREAVAEVPEELRRLRRELGFDFGKFDYALIDGRVVLYDANRTPSIANLPRERSLPVSRLLAEGIRTFL